MKKRDEFLKDLDWAGKHHSQLLQDYRDEWVAVYNQKVVAHGTSLEIVEKEAERKTRKDKEEIPVYFVESGSNIYACKPVL